MPRPIEEMLTKLLNKKKNFPTVRNILLQAPFSFSCSIFICKEDVFKMSSTSNNSKNMDAIY